MNVQKWSRIRLRLTLLASMVVLSATTAADEGSLTSLFDGTTLNGWNTVQTAKWRVDDGIIESDTGSGVLVTARSFDNFQLKLEFWVSDDANSGVFIRCSESAEPSDTACYEVNIFDRRPDQTYRTGSIVHVAAPSEKIDAGGHWNTYEITADGPHLTVVLNGVKTVDVENDKLSSGPIALQRGSGVVKFRNIQLRPL